MKDFKEMKVPDDEDHFPEATSIPLLEGNNPRLVSLFACVQYYTITIMIIHIL